MLQAVHACCCTKRDETKMNDAVVKIFIFQAKNFKLTVVVIHAADIDGVALVAVVVVLHKRDCRTKQATN